LLGLGTGEEGRLSLGAKEIKRKKIHKLILITGGIHAGITIPGIMINL
jgi:hypothetical protein